MSVKATGAEIKAFIADDEFWSLKGIVAAGGKVN